MPQICDYAIGKASDDAPAMTLGGRRDLDFELTLPTGTLPQAESVVTFLVHADDPDDLTFTLRIGSHSKPYTINSDVMRTFQEIIGGGALIFPVPPRSGNSVHFRLDSGDGILHITDVVLWFQRSI